MSSKNNIGSLLEKERKSLRFSLKQVAAKMGIKNYQTIASIEAGEREIKAWELAKLAQIYCRPVEFFFSGISQARQSKVMWRETQKNSQTEQAERKLLALCENYRALLELTNESEKEYSELLALKKTDFLKAEFDYVVEVADTYRRLLDLGSRPASCLSDVIEQKLGVLVLYLDLGAGGSAASTAYDGIKAIVINSKDSPWRCNFNLAHELFHIITWDIFNDTDEIAASTTKKADLEKWADAFASAILLPSDSVRDEIKKKAVKDQLSYASIVEIARDFRVSTDALLWRTVNLKILKKNDVEKSLKSGGGIKEIDRGMRRDDWSNDKPYLSSRYVALALKALSTGMISRAKFAEYVGISFSDIPSFLAGYGYDEDRDYSIALTTS